MTSPDIDTVVVLNEVGQQITVRLITPLYSKTAYNTLQAENTWLREVIRQAYPIIQDAVFRANASYGQNFRQEWTNKVRASEASCKDVLAAKEEV